MTILREQAQERLLEIFSIDFHDWLHASYPDKAKQHAAIVVVELQLEIMVAEEKADHAVERLRSARYDWRFDHAMILSYANEISQYADRVAMLTRMRNLAIVPFRRGGVRDAV